MSYQKASLPKRKLNGDPVSLRQTEFSRSNLRTDRCDYWSHRGHTESYLLKAGHQFTTTEG